MATRQDVKLATGSKAPQRNLAWGALSALGIVFGDLGTSPLYTLQTVVASTGDRFTQAGALGILSLIFWTLVLTVSVKYCLFVMRADNHGEGGILALMSRVGANNVRGRAAVWTAVGLLGAALIYGDGIITPAISVLSALEGANAADPALARWTLPATLVVLAVLFLSQRFGTARIGGAFGPVMLAWFIVIGALGLIEVVHAPSVLRAIDPIYAVRFLRSEGRLALMVLGGVFLCITGGEALYADMGHFGRNPIRCAWFVVALPALLLNYAGQAALLISHGRSTGNPFFQLAPDWGIYPLVALATVATIIASQSIITGSFSMTRQAMQLGWFPGVNIRQTSDRLYGQIYVPSINWMMMAATMGIAVLFGSSTKLAGAYGMAVSATMLFTTLLLYRAMRHVWHWPLIVAAPLAGLFLLVDGSFVAANLLKFLEGGWIPLTFGILMFLLMTSWRAGMEALRASLSARVERGERVLAKLKSNQIPRVPGTAIFLTQSDRDVPHFLADYVRYMGSLHETVITARVVFEEYPRVSPTQRSHVRRVVDGLWHVTIRFGFLEVPSIQPAIQDAKGFHAAIDCENAVFFAARDIVVRNDQAPRLARWRLALFGFLYRNAVRAVDRFSLPPVRTVELARQVEV